MESSQDILDVVLALIKERQFEKANRVLIDKADEVLSAQSRGNKLIVGELVKEIFILNRLISEYKSKLENIREQVNDLECLKAFDKALLEIENKRKEIINMKRNISFGR